MEPQEPVTPDTASTRRPLGAGAQVTAAAVPTGFRADGTYVIQFQLPLSQRHDAVSSDTGKTFRMTTVRLSYSASTYGWTCIRAAVVGPGTTTNGSLHATTTHINQYLYPAEEGNPQAPEWLAEYARAYQPGGGVTRAHADEAGQLKLRAARAAARRFLAATDNLDD